MKIKSIYVLHIFLLITCNAFSQQRKIDSLERLLEQHTEQDTVRFNLLFDLSELYIFYDTNKGLAMSDKAIRLGQKLGPLYLAGGYKNKGANHMLQGDDSLAIVFYEKAKDIYSAEQYWSGVAKTVYNIGYLLSDKSKYRKSTEQFLKAYQIFEKERDTLHMARSLNIIAINNMYLSDYPKALEWYQKADRLYEAWSEPNEADRTDVQSNMGTLYQKMGKFEKALEHRKKALAQYEKIDDKQGMARELHNLGKSYSSLGNYNKAISLYGKAIAIERASNHKIQLGLSFNNRGMVFTKLGDYDSAIKDLERAKSIFKKLGNKNYLSATNSGLGDVYMAKGNLKKAKQVIELALQGANTGDLDLQSSIWENLALVDAKLKDYKGAYEALLKMGMIKDSILSEDKIEEIARLEEKYKYEKEKAIIEADFEKNKAIDENKIKQQKLIRNISIGGGILGITALAVILTLYRRKKEADLNEELAKSELSKIRAQLNPHFIFNSLSSISDFVQKNEKNKAQNYIGQFSAMMRKILDHSEEEEIPLEKEIEFLDGYIKLEQQRLENGFKYKIDVDEDIDMEDTLVPPALYQPFIENSIIYGLPEKKGDGLLEISFRKERNTLTCVIDDNGIGIQKEKGAGNKKSFGIKSARDRVSLLKQIKKTEAQIEIIEKEEGIRVVIQIPFSLEF